MNYIILWHLHFFFPDKFVFIIFYLLFQVLYKHKLIIFGGFYDTLREVRLVIDSITRFESIVEYNLGFSIIMAYMLTQPSQLDRKSIFFLSSL